MNVFKNIEGVYVKPDVLQMWILFNLALSKRIIVLKTL